MNLLMRWWLWLWLHFLVSKEIDWLKGDIDCNNVGEWKAVIKELLAS